MQEAAAALPTVRLRHHATLTGRPGGERVAVSIGPDGNLISLRATARDQPALSATFTHRNGVRSPRTRAPRPAAARVVTHTPEPATAAGIPELPLAHATVQPMPQGRVPVVGARSTWRPEEPDRNAIVYDADGTVVAQETLGDGISRVFTTDSGHAWVGYLDEGIYGNFGWGGPTGPSPTDRDGPVRFSSGLQEDRRLPAGPGSRGQIDECRVLGIDGGTVWTCFHSRSPLVRVRDGEAAGRHNGVGGAAAPVVDGPRAALFGGCLPEKDHHRPDGNQLTAGTPDQGRFHVTGRYRVVLPDGRPLPGVVQPCWTR